MSRLLVVLLLGLAACGGSGAPAADRGQPAGTVTVLAAASLTEAFAELGEQFEAAHPEADVVFSFGSSSALAQAVTAGAPADVYASASADAMEVVTDAGAAAGQPQVIARNVLQIAVPAGNPGGVTGLADLADPSLTVALCAEQVPCGQAAAAVLEAAGVVVAPDTLERDVKAALSKVVLGEVDAALVYRTDVRAAGAAVEAVDVPGAAASANTYAVVALERAANPVAARAFVELVTSPAGREVLTGAGFEAP
jgi:molybdate transport system substrate-binding protein